MIVCSLGLYCCYKLPTSLDTYGYACVAERIAVRTSSIEQLIEQYGQTSVISAFGVAKMHKLSAISKIDTIVDSDLLKRVQAIGDVGVAKVSKEWGVSLIYLIWMLFSGLFKYCIAT